MKQLLLLLILVIHIFTFGQSNDSLRFPILHFNPYENFHFISFNKMKTPQLQDEFEFDDYEYLVPFGLGIQKDLYHKKNYLLSASTSINVQFIFRNEDSPVLQGIRKTLFNTDFFLRIHNTFRLTTTDKLRVTLYHRSTHLGDDYTLLNKINNVNYWREDESNYEAIQVQYAKEKKSFLIYVGTQFGTRPNTPRKRIEFHQGTTLRNLFGNSSLNKFFIGYDIKLLENNNYNIDTDIGIGYLLKHMSGSTSSQVIFLLVGLRGLRNKLG